MSARPAQPLREEPLRVHIDTDPGVDDLLALAVAFASPEIRVVGITTVAGNAPLEAVTENARRFVALAGERIPVGRGAAKPLRAPPVTAAHIHGADGRHGIALPEPGNGPVLDATETFRYSLEEQGARTILALGPLTNLAALLERSPRLLAGSEIVWMGGTLGEGNVTPMAEFNCYADPDAAEAVLTSDLSVRVVGLDATRCVALRRKHVESVTFARGARGRVIGELLSRQMEAERRAAGEARVTLHDPTALAALLAPERFRFEPRSLSVRRGEGAERGRLLPTQTPGSRSVRYATSAEGEPLARLCLERLRRFARPSPSRERL